MAGMEALRQKLYLALEDGNTQNILKISRELDYEIVKFIKGKMNNGAKKISQFKERNCEYGRSSE